MYTEYLHGICTQNTYMEYIHGIHPWKTYMEYIHRIQHGAHAQESAVFRVSTPQKSKLR